MTKILKPAKSAELWFELLELLRSQPPSSPGWYNAINRAVTCLVDDRLQYFRNVAALSLDERGEGKE